MNGLCHSLGLEKTLNFGGVCLGIVRVSPIYYVILKSQLSVYVIVWPSAYVVEFWIGKVSQLISVLSLHGGWSVLRLPSIIWG